MLLLTRPEEQSLKTAKVLDRMNIKYFIEPIMSLQYYSLTLDVAAIKRETKYILLTSSNTLVAIKNYIKDLSSIKLIVVGKTTMEKAKDAGFKNIVYTASDSQAAADYIANNLKITDKILYLSGKDIAFDITEYLNKLHYNIERKIVYETIERESFSSNLIDLVQKNEIDNVVFFSVKTAKIFINLVKLHKLEKKLINMSAFCLSKNIEEAIKHIRFKKIYTSKSPNSDSLLALIKDKLV